MKYLFLLLMGALVLSCGKVDPSKIDRTLVTDQSVLTQDHVSGPAGSFGGVWKGSGTGTVIKEESASNFILTIDQDAGALSVQFQGDMSSSAHFQYNFGKLKIDGNTLSTTSSTTSAGVLGRKGFMIHDSKTSAQIDFRKDGDKSATFRIVAQERLPSGKFVQYRFEGQLGL